MAAPRSAKLVALICAGVVVTMTGAAFAAVPLYRMFCQVTGFNGTTTFMRMQANLAARTAQDHAIAASAPAQQPTSQMAEASN